MKKLLFFILLMSFIACVKKDEGKSAPVVTISTPSEGQEFISGSPIAIKGSASDDASLHEGTVVVVKTDNNAEYFRKEPAVHDLRNFIIDYSYTPSVSAATNLKIIATFYDHDDNKTEKVVNIKVKP